MQGNRIAAMNQMIPLGRGGFPEEASRSDPPVPQPRQRLRHRRDPRRDRRSVASRNDDKARRDLSPYGMWHGRRRHRRLRAGASRRWASTISSWPTTCSGPTRGSTPILAGQLLAQGGGPRGAHAAGLPRRHHAAVTLATGILILPQRQTPLVAKQAAQIDVMSGGRLRLGIGVGWNVVEFEALDETSTTAAAGAPTDRGLRALWTKPRGLPRRVRSHKHAGSTHADPATDFRSWSAWQPRAARAARGGPRGSGGRANGWSPNFAPDAQGRGSSPRARVPREAGVIPRAAARGPIRLAGQDPDGWTQGRAWKALGATAFIAEPRNAGLLFPERPSARAAPLQGHAQGGPDRAGDAARSSPITSDPGAISVPCVLRGSGPRRREDRVGAFPLHAETPADGRSLADLFAGRNMDRDAMHAADEGADGRRGAALRRAHDDLQQPPGPGARQVGGTSRAARRCTTRCSAPTSSTRATSPGPTCSSRSPSGLGCRSRPPVRCWSSGPSGWRRRGLGLSRRYGITGVPTFVAGRHGAVGAQPYEVLEQLVRRARQPPERRRVGRRRCRSREGGARAAAGDWPGVCPRRDRADRGSTVRGHGRASIHLVEGDHHRLVAMHGELRPLADGSGDTLRRSGETRRVGLRGSRRAGRSTFATCAPPSAARFRGLVELGLYNDRVRTILVVPLLAGWRGPRRHRHPPDTRPAVHRASRSPCSRASPTRPPSPSRTPACRRTLEAQRTAS